MSKHRCVLLAAGLVVAGCAAGPKPSAVTGDASVLEIRAFQTRQYDTLDKTMAIRSVIATLQDLGFVLDKADLALGTVTATRHHEYTMRMTVTVREISDTRVAVRANARIGERSVEDALTYRDFFVVLDKSLFLTRNRVD